MGANKLQSELENILFDIEQELWNARGNTEVFEEYTSDDVLYILSGIEVAVDKQTFLTLLPLAPLWKRVEISNGNLRMLSNTSAVIVYSVKAHYATSSGEIFSAIISSTYRLEEDGNWRVVTHHQSPN